MGGRRTGLSCVGAPRRMFVVIALAGSALAFAPSASPAVQAAAGEPSSGSMGQAAEDAGGDAGPHTIRRVVVDEDGQQTRVRLRHAGAAWSGVVRIRFDVSGGPRPEFRAKVHRGTDRPPTFLKADGSRWRCADRVATSETTASVTKFLAARRCFGEATRLHVRPRVQLATDGSGTKPPLQDGEDRSRPNVVMIMVDDMRDDDLRYMPLTQALIGDQGVRFVNSLAPYPLCCPARASVLTGQYTHNHRVWSHKAPWGFSAFDDRSTLATWLQDAGYHTTYVGKYLNGYGYMAPFGHDSGVSTSYVPPGWSDWRASIDGGLGRQHPDDGSTYRYMDTTLVDNGVGFDNYQGRYQTRVFGKLSEGIVTERAASEQPFFYYVSYTAPHFGRPFDPDDPAPVANDAGVMQEFKTPMVPRAVRGTFDEVITEAPGADWFDQPRSPFDRPAYLQGILPMNDAEKAALLEVTRQRAESLSVVDQQVAATITALEQTGELDNTLIMFTSDNGYFLGEQGIRTGKTLPHEASIHTPLLIRGPGIPAGEVRYDPFLSIDFAPTIAEAAAVVPAGPVDGMSMWSVARQGDQGWTRAVLTETGRRGIVRDTDEAGEPLTAEDPGGPDLRYAIGVRSDRYLYVHLANGDEELYDMALDPAQYDNRANDEAYATIRELMRSQLALLRACDAGECLVELPPELAAGPGESIQNPE